MSKGSSSRPSAPQPAFSLPRLATCLLFWLLAIHASLSASTPLQNLNGEDTALETLLQPPSTLVLIVHEIEELSAAQTLLTQAYADDLPALVLIQRPEHFKRDLALRRAAKQFFTSEFSQARIYLLKADDNPYPESQTLLLAPESPAPTFQSPALTYPN